MLRTFAEMDPFGKLVVVLMIGYTFSILLDSLVTELRLRGERKRQKRIDRGYIPH